MYAVQSIARMTILGVLYFVIGLILFQKRKMEQTGESFASIKLHMFVKALTILPMIILLNLIDAELEFNVFAVALIIVYYFIFDLVVKRKVKLPVSIVGVIVILLVLQGICSGTEWIKSKLPEETIAKEDIKAVSVGYIPTTYRYHYFDLKNNILDVDYYTEDKALIDFIFDAGIRCEKQVQYLNNHIYDSNTVNETYLKNDEINYQPYTVLDMNIKTKTGNILSVRIDIFETDHDKLITQLGENQEYLNTIKQTFTNAGKIGIEDMLLEEQDQKAMEIEIQKALENVDLEKLLDKTYPIEGNIYLYVYKNHKLQTRSLPANISTGTLKITANCMNAFTKTELEKAIKEGVYYGAFSVEDYEEEGQVYFVNKEKQIENFIMQHASDNFDSTAPYRVISGTVKGTNIRFFTNLTEEIDELIQQEKAMVY